VARFSHADLEAVVELLGEAVELEGTEPFPQPFLERLGSLLRSSNTVYAHLDFHRRQVLDGASVADFRDDPAVEALYWDYADECPTAAYRWRTGDPAAVRLDDVISRRAWRRRSFYNAYWRPYDLEHYVEVGLPAPPKHHHFVGVARHRDASDFSERDRDLLELLRPHLARICELAELRARFAANGIDDKVAATLTPREQEIVDLVAQGKTNAEIATILWVAPSTVKKHLEHVYEKLGVGRRAAVAAARTGSLAQAPVSGA
jgi:DNA-binding CsgD family transcriptional regulator